MSRKGNRPLVDLSSGGTLEQVVAEAQGRALRIELVTGMRMVREGKTNALATTCTAYLYTTRQNPSGSQSFVPLCMPMVGETWNEVLAPLGQLLDQESWTDVGRAS
jgi:hypothetical protein